MSAHKFNRMHIPSGRVTEGEFNASHSEIFAAPDYYAFKVIEQTKLFLVNKWNANLPKEWKYWL